jgi:hypothetical protein
MQRAEVGLLPHAARTSADGPLDSLGAAGLGLKVQKRHRAFVALRQSLVCTSPCRMRQLANLWSEQVLPMTTHSIQVGQGLATNVVHRLLPLPDRGGGGSLHQGANFFPLLIVHLDTNEEFFSSDFRRSLGIAHSSCSGSRRRIFARQRPCRGLLHCRTSNTSLPVFHSS